MTSLAPHSKFSVRQGYQFWFNIAGQELCAQGSVWSGREIITLNDQAISDKRNYRVKSLHQFSIGLDNYELEFNMVSIIMGTLECTLVKNGVHLSTQSICSIKDNPKVVGAFFIGGFMVGSFGFAAAVWLA